MPRGLAPCLFTYHKTIKMKKSILTLFIFAVLFSACKKEEEEESKPLTKEELLCQTWSNESYSLDGISYAWLARLYHWKFKTNGTIEWYEIETGNLYKTTNWAWAEDKEALDIEQEISNGFTTESVMVRANILSLTESEMLLKPGNSDHKLEMNFKR